MHVIVVAIALLFWVSPALAEQKSAPDGFGPIKFGMTKDEAWEAIGGQGEWVEHKKSDELVHEIELRQPLTEATVKAEAHHFFVDGGQGAGFGFITATISTSGERCGTWAAQYATLIQGIYGAVPVEHSGVLDDAPRTFFTSLVFGFSNGISINVVTYQKPIAGMPVGGALCELFIEFTPPGPIVDLF